MTLVDPGRVQQVRPGGPWWKRLWGAPVWAHLAALAVILLLLVPVIGPSQSFLADEGAAAIQASSLAREAGWLVKHPVPEVDPTGGYYPTFNVDRGASGFAPLAKHPLYSLLAAGAWRLGGMAGVILLSIAGTVAAAAVAGALARRIDPVLGRVAIWTVGLASPLVFDSYLAMGHTLGAALAGAAVLAAVVAVEDRRPAMALAVAPSLGAAVLLRNEALLFAASLAVVAGVLALLRRPRFPAALVAVVTVATAAGVHLVEKAWVAHIVGGPVALSSLGVPAVAEGGRLQGRIDGFLVTWLTPAYNSSTFPMVPLLVMLAAIAWCAARVRLHPLDRPGIVVPAAVAAGAAVVALVTAPANIVPGLLLAFPVGTPGLFLMRRQVLAGLAGATAALFTLAVLATQYALGGTGEWGGRYFALMLPFTVPLVLAALYRQGQLLATGIRRPLAGALVVCSLALSTMAVNGMRANHDAKATVVARIEAAGRAAGGDRPVVVTTLAAGARLAWPTFDDFRWLYVPKDQVADVAGRLREAGVGRFVLLTTDLPALEEQLARLTVVSVDGPADGQGRQILVVDG